MISILAQGFTLGLAYAMPIGAQNLFVINSASQGTMKDSLKTALIFAAMDISLGIACIVGVGQAIQSHDLVRLAVGGIGSAFLLFIGYKLLVRKVSSNTEHVPTFERSVWKSAFLLTWCNPHAIIDGSVLLGGYQSSFSLLETYFFASGLALASSAWFLSISIMVNRFKTSVTNRMMTNINRLCGVAMIIFGVRLAISLVSEGL